MSINDEKNSKETISRRLKNIDCTWRKRRGKVVWERDARTAWEKITYPFHSRYFPLASALGVLTLALGCSQSGLGGLLRFRPPLFLRRFLRSRACANKTGKKKNSRSLLVDCFSNLSRRCARFEIGWAGFSGERKYKGELPSMDHYPLKMNEYISDQGKL